MDVRAILRSKKRTVGGVAIAAVMIGAVACTGGGGEPASPVSEAPSTDEVVAAVVATFTAIDSVVISRQPPTGAPEPVVEAVGKSAVGESSARAIVGSAVQQPGANQQTGIWVNGIGRIDVEPDIATLNIGVEAREATVKRARDAAAGAMQLVIEAVKAEGVAGDDVVTTSFNIQPQVVYREVRERGGAYSVPEIVGYIVSNTVRVTIRDLDRVGGVVDAAAAEAGDLVRINSIRFGVDDTSQYAEDLRRLAAADARAKAEIYAAAMGVEVGTLIFLSETGSSAPVVVREVAVERAFALAAAAPTPIQAGDTTLTANIQAVFSIVIG